MVTPIYFYPSARMIEVVDYLNNKLEGKIKLVELPLDRDRRISHLERIEGDGIYVWESGLFHGESYHFDFNAEKDGKLEKIIVKVGIDAHPDLSGLEEVENPKYSKLYNSHFYYSGKDHGNLVFVISKEGFAFSNKNTKTPLFLEKSEENIYKGLLVTYSKNADKIHLSVDMDAIKGFPSEEDWRRDGFLSLEGLKKEIENLYVIIKRRINRMDVGGLAEFMDRG